MVAPFAVSAVNNVTLDGPVNFEFSSTIIVGQTGGAVTDLAVNASDMIVTLDDASSAIRFDKTSGSTYFVVTEVTSVGDYSVLPVCPDSYIDIAGGSSGTVQLKIEMTNVRPGCLPPINPPLGGQVDLYPLNYSVNINNGATCTISSSVTLNLASENASEVMISNTSDFSGAVWQVFNFSSKVWPLEPGNGIRPVYVQYKSATGRISPVLSASIAVNSAGCEVIPPLPSPSLSSGNYSANEAMNSAFTISIDKGVLPLTTAPLCVAESLIKLPDDHNPLTQADSTVYYCGVDGRRYVFPNPATYFSWYSSYDNIQIISAADMAAIPLGANNVTIRPGSRLVKFATSRRVYAVAQDGVLRWVVDEATAVALYGADWNDWVVDVSDTFFPNYSFGDDITLDLVTSGSVLPSPNLLRISILTDIYSF